MGFGLLNPMRRPVALTGSNIKEAQPSPVSLSWTSPSTVPSEFTDVAWRSSVPMNPFVRLVTVVQDRPDNGPLSVVYAILRFLLLLPPPPFALFQSRSRLTAVVAKPIAR